MPSVPTHRSLRSCVARARLARHQCHGRAERRSTRIARRSEAIGKPYAGTLTLCPAARTLVRKFLRFADVTVGRYTFGLKV